MYWRLGIRNLWFLTCNTKSTEKLIKKIDKLDCDKILNVYIASKDAIKKVKCQPTHRMRKTFSNYMTD